MPPGHPDLDRWPGRRGTIVVLTYHEITEDARILKEARVARDAGWDVHILSEWPAGKPQTETLEGMRVTRFDCFATDGLTPAIWEEFTFLDRSRARLEETVLPLLRDQETLDRRYDGLMRRVSGNGRQPASAERAVLRQSYYKRHKGPARMLCKVRHLHARYRLLGRKTPDGARVGLAYMEELRRLESRVRAGRKRLFQGHALIYAVNAARLALIDEAKAGEIVGVHAHDIYTLPFGVLLSRRLGVPLIYDAHEYEPARATRMASKNDPLPRDIEDDCFDHVDRMITVSSGIADLYEARFHGPRPTLVMNAPEVSTETSASGVAIRNGLATVREQAKLGRDVPIVVFTGELQGAHRGMDKVVDAVSRLPGFHLVILGPRNPRHDSWFLELVQRFGIDDRIALLPPVDAREVPAAVSSANVAVLPFQDVSLNHRLAMPNKLFEAAFGEVPICVSDLPEMRRFVERLGIGRVMDQTNPAAIAEALADVNANRERYACTAEARRLLREVYSWHRQGATLVALYEDVLARARPLP